MQAVIFIGIQASGKSTFCRDRFFNSHIRINLDMLKTRHREKILFQACLKAKQPFVVDNTNPTREDRARYLGPAKDCGFRVIGYYFHSKLEDCKRRNAQRTGKARIPIVGIAATYKKLILPSYAEGFDELYSVKIAEKITKKIAEKSAPAFIVEEWPDEI